MKRNIALFGAFCFLSASLPFCGSSNNNLTKNKADSFTDFASAENWINLPGFEYKTAGIYADGEKFPAVVNFPSTCDSTGIDVNFKGYYSGGYGDSQGNGFSGLVYKNKMKLEDLSVIFTINKLGANSAIGDDGWISVSFLTKPNMFSTTDTSINMGSVPLLRTQTRSITVYNHEIGESGGTKYANFSTGTNVSLDLDTYPSCEGSTIRVSYVKESTAAATKYYLKVEQIDFETKEVISSKTTANPLIHSDDYAGDEKLGYLVFSASTDNFEKQWDISIKNINGVDIGTQSNVSPLTPEEKAEKVTDLVNNLKMFDYFDDAGQLTNEGKVFYSPNNSELDIDTALTELSTILYGFNDDDCDALSSMNRLASTFESPEAFKNYLVACVNKMIDNYESIEADNLIEDINNAVNELPALNEVSISNEQKVSDLIASLQLYYYNMKSKAIDKYGATARQNLWDNIIVKYSDKLDDVKFEKLGALVADLPNDVTEQNLKDTISSLIPSEMIIEYFTEESKISAIQINKPAMYSSILEYKSTVEGVRSEVNTFKSSQRVYVEDLEKSAEINYYVYYLVTNPTLEDFERVFNILSSYSAISDEAKTYVDDEEKLFSVCAKALKIAIDNLPALEQLTKDSYVVNSYDVEINNVNKKYTMLKNANRDCLNEVTNINKLNKLVDKLSKILNPLYAKTIITKEIKANEVLTIDFVDLFTNYNLRNYQVTSNYGTVDTLNENVKFDFSDNGTYEVKVTIVDQDYGDTAVASFKIIVTGAVEKTGGCGGSILASSMLVSFLALCGATLLGKKRRG